MKLSGLKTKGSEEPVWRMYAVAVMSAEKKQWKWGHPGEKAKWSPESVKVPKRYFQDSPKVNNIRLHTGGKSTKVGAVLVWLWGRLRDILSKVLTNPAPQHSLSRRCSYKQKHDTWCNLIEQHKCVPSHRVKCLKKNQLSTKDVMIYGQMTFQSILNCSAVFDTWQVRLGYFICASLSTHYPHRQQDKRDKSTQGCRSVIH